MRIVGVPFIREILEEISSAKGSNLKKSILEREKNNEVLKKVLLYANNPYKPFNIKKIPRSREKIYIGTRDDVLWEEFFDVADRCANREVTGNDAISLMSEMFSRAPADDESWMRKVLNKHLNIGISTKSINKVYGDLIPVFSVQLAEKFEEKKIARMDEVFVEPKLDGVRCISIVKDDGVTMFTRSGKEIENFVDTIGQEVLGLGEGVYDGEIMSDDFQKLMTQVNRKKNVDVSESKYHIFDFIPLDDWLSQSSVMSYEDRRKELWDRFSRSRKTPELKSWIKLVSYRKSSPEEIDEFHKGYVSKGYEGTMIKDPKAPYRWGRGKEVLKLKNFFDVDAEVVDLEEGTGRNSGRLGAIVIDVDGVKVNVGSGFSDEQRDEIWKDRSKYVGLVAECRYQERTKDKDGNFYSLRFPTFVQFRMDKEL